MNALHVVTLGVDRLWRTFVYVIVFIGFEPIKAYICKLFNKAGILYNVTTPHSMVVHDDRVFHRMICGGALGLGEAYVDGWWDCIKLDDFFYNVFKSDLCQKKLLPWDKFIHYFNYHVSNLRTEARSQDVADKHCDTGNHVFKAFLDTNINYTCGYWRDAKNLNEAQLHQMELIGRKLKLKPGMRVLDIGCGWGGLCKFLAEKYKVEVVGVTNLKECAEDARVRCKGVKVDIRLQDYREIRNEVFDRIVIVGFLEHGGRKNCRSFLKHMRRCLSARGIVLIQTIGFSNDCTSPIDLFLTKYIFPNGMLPTHKDIQKAIVGILCLADWHNFGPDYDKTLTAWNDNLAKNWPSISHTFENPESTYRTWNYFFLMCTGFFRASKCRLGLLTLKTTLALEEYE